MIQFSNKAYDVLKYLCLVFSPALCTLITAIAKLYGWDVTNITGIITAVTFFIGTLIGISTKNYNSEKEGSDSNE